MKTIEELVSDEFDCQEWPTEDEFVVIRPEWLKLRIKRLVSTALMELRPEDLQDALQSQSLPEPDEQGERVCCGMIPHPDEIRRASKIEPYAPESNKEKPCQPAGKTDLIQLIWQYADEANDVEEFQRFIAHSGITISKPFKNQFKEALLKTEWPTTDGLITMTPERLNDTLLSLIDLMEAPVEHISGYYKWIG